MEKKLKRSKNQILGGVCAGLANYFNLDYTLIRALFALLTIFSAAFPGIVLYIVLWIIMPLEEEEL